MEKNVEMKPGDKVWQIGCTAWYLDRNSMRIKSAIVTDVFVYGTKRKFCLLSLNDKLQPRLSSAAAFPTREALCEHYRKIFTD